MSHTFAQGKEQLQQSFLNHPDGQPFSQEQVEYAAEDAVVAAKLYPLQVVAATSAGLLEHHVQIEMPWTKVTARMEWTGVWVDREKLQRLGEGCKVKLDQTMEDLKPYGHRKCQEPPPDGRLLSGCRPVE